MLKYLFFLAIGIAGGYTYGWKDAKEHDDPIVTRLVNKAGGEARKQYGNDIDGQMDRLEKR
jgi:hypothetical protein